MVKKKGSTDDFASILGDIKPEGQTKESVTQETIPVQEAGKVSGNDAQTTSYARKLVMA